MTAGYILAIDQGTTGSEVLIFDHDGAIKSWAYSEFTQYYPKPGWVEHDAEEWKDRRELEEKWKVGRRYEPQMSEEERVRLHSRWLRAVERAKGWERDEN